MNLPSEFISNIEGVFGEAGKNFLANLPALIDEASQRWGLTNTQPSPTLSYNFVAFANRGEEQVVLKMGVPNQEMKSEIAALRLFDGEGACHIIDYDEEKCWMLLERLKPGVMLVNLEDDEEATHIAVEVMQKIWRPVEHVTLSPSASLRINSAKSLEYDKKRLSPALPGTARQGVSVATNALSKRHIVSLFSYQIGSMD